MVKRILVFCLIADLLLVSACTKKTKTMKVVFSDPLSDSLYVEILLTDTDEIVGMDFNIVYQSQDWLFQKIFTNPTKAVRLMVFCRVQSRHSEFADGKHAVFPFLPDTEHLLF